MSNEIKPVVLIVEDERPQLEMLAYNLNKQGFKTVETENGEEALLAADENDLDIVILDWMLPNVSGIEVCRQLRSKRSTRKIPIIMLTARGEEADMVRGFETGADDYVVKPYSISELIARVRALLRRTRPSSVGQILTCSDITVDTERHQVRRSGEPVHLGPIEYRLLCVLMERPGRVLNREQLLDLVWGRDKDVDYRTVDVHIGRLRKALRKPGSSEPVRTIRGTGYAIETG